MSIEVELNGKAGRVCKEALAGQKHCPLIVRTTSEDVLVGNVFGLLRHIRPHLWLNPLLNLALYGDANARVFRQVYFKKFQIRLWERQERFPPELLDFREGRSEPDIIIEWENPPTTIWIEAKYNAKLAEGTSNNPLNNQVIRGTRTKFLEDQLRDEQRRRQMQDQFDFTQKDAVNDQQRRRDDMEWGYTFRQRQEQDRLANAEATIQTWPDATDEEKQQALDEIRAQRAGIRPVHRLKPAPLELGGHKEGETFTENGYVFTIGRDKDGKVAKIRTGKDPEKPTYQDRIHAVERATILATTKNAIGPDTFDQDKYDAAMKRMGFPLEGVSPSTDPAAPSGPCFGRDTIRRRDGHLQWRV